MLEHATHRGGEGRLTLESRSVPVTVRNTLPRDVPGVIALCRKVYPESAPWRPDQLERHQVVFPEGQWVAVDGDRVVGMAASLIVRWDDYDSELSWREFTAQGTFTNHDPVHGRTLYAAEVMVDPTCQGGGIGGKLYAARRALVEQRFLRRIRAGARLRGYHHHADTMSAEEYAVAVARGDLYDPTLTFQLRQGFHVLRLVEDYLRHDPESLGWAACIEWRNPAVETPEDRAAGDPRFLVPFAGSAARRAGRLPGSGAKPRVQRVS
jgi:GNAT superfamily N-acetyltransferase